MKATRPSATPKVAIVHDWLYGGGAERVIYQLHKLYPDAPIYTSYCSDEWRKRLGNKVITGYLQHWPFAQLRKLLPVLRLRWFESLDLSAYDLVISSSGNGEAFGVKAGSTFKPGQVHVCYSHTPTHFYWRHYDTYMKRPGFGVFDPVVRLGLRLLVGPLRAWDYKAAQRPDYFIANSTHIQSDIKQYYDRDAVVIHPPVDTDRFNVPAPKKRTGFVTADRQVPAKHIDYIIQACNELKLPLKVVGRGPEHANLVAMAGPTIEFFDNVSDNEMPAYFVGAEAFIKASFEDFGVTPVEALAAGTPVIAYKAGGALDYVEPGITGEFFNEQSVKSLVVALKKFDPKKYEHTAITQYAQQFSEAEFRRKMSTFIQKVAP